MSSAFQVSDFKGQAQSFPSIQFEVPLRPDTSNRICLETGQGTQTKFMSALGSPHPPRKPNPVHLTCTNVRACTHMHRAYRHTHTLSPLTPSWELNCRSTKTLQSARCELVCPSSHEELGPCGNQIEPWRTYGKNTHRSCLHGTRHHSHWYTESLAGNRSENKLCWRRSGPDVLSPSQLVCRCERQTSQQTRGVPVSQCGLGHGVREAPGVRPSQEGLRSFPVQMALYS